MSPQGRQPRLDRVDDRDRIGPRLPVDTNGDPILAVVAARQKAVLDAVDDRADVGETNRRAIPVGDDLAQVLGSLCQLAFRLDHSGALRTVQRTRRKVHIGGADGGGNLIDANPSGGQLIRIDLDAYRRM